MQESALERYGVFSAVCFVYAVAILWMLFRRRITLQSSLTYLTLMVGLGLGFVVLRYVPDLVSVFGFTLPSNLFFSVAIATLAYLHLSSLVAMSRVEERSTALVQEVALLQEQIDRLRADTSARARFGSDPAPPLKDA
ncbi:MAG: DUF2304 domain-containing protein [Deltaproteobacteria bacterium]|nr:DUF2304 domain-containing protein [Deltaproteobacteria bacterium]